MSIADNDALFNLIGTTYGGDGQSTFALPDLRGRVPLHMGQGPGLSNYIIGQNGGTEAVTLTTLQLPQHSHAAMAQSQTGGQSECIIKGCSIYCQIIIRVGTTCKTAGAIRGIAVCSRGEAGKVVNTSVYGRETFNLLTVHHFGGTCP
jgi:microcystin-dependent protein